MASRSALTEEGRTRIRNFSGRLNSYLILWLTVGLVAVLASIWLRTRYGYLPLQRLYLTQYTKASVRSFLFQKRTSKYTVLVRVVDAPNSFRHHIIRCTDEEVEPIRDGNGKVRFEPKLGPFFRLREGIPHEYFYWLSTSENDREMYQWFRSYIYAEHSLFGLYWVCLLPFPLIAIAGMFLSVKLDVRINREYEEGSLLRGVRLLSHKEYLHESRPNNGVGLPVLKVERRLR